MYKRLAIYLFVASSLAVVILWQRTRVMTTPQPATAGHALPQAPLVVEPPEHVAPDKRALIAVSELDRLVTGRPGRPAQALFAEGRWHVVVDSTEVGTWPEYPDFADIVSLLSQRATSLRVADEVDREHPEIDQALDAFKPLEALLSADRAWASGDRSPSLHHAALRALVQVTAQSTDLVGTADLIGSRALAELAVCKAMGIQGLQRDEALLADRLGYGAHAWAVSESLAADDPIRLYVRRDDNVLARFATASGASAEARFLLLSRLAQKHDDLEYQRYADRYFESDTAITLPALATMLTLGSFQSQMPSAEMVLSAISDDFRLFEGADPIAAVEPPTDLGLAIQRFEKMMSSMNRSADGEWLDGQLLRAHYRAAFYSAMWRIGEFDRVSLSSLAATRDLAIELQNLPPGPANEFGRWYTHLAAAKLGHPAPLDLRGDLTSLRSFGSLMRFATLEACGQTPIGRLRGTRDQACLLLGQLDTRPGDRLNTVELIRDQVLDLAWAESLLANTARIASPADAGVQAWWARMNDDRVSELAMLDAPGLSAGEADLIAIDLAEMSLEDTAAVCTAYRKIITRFPDAVNAALKFNEFSWKHLHREEPGRRALKAWLAHPHGDDEGLDRVHALTALARSYQREKKYRQALAIVEPVAESQQFGAMSATADLMDLCGRGAEAETLAAFALHRYPDSPDALVDLAGLFWRHQRYDDAATVLQGTAYRLDDAHWFSVVAPKFADDFETRPPQALLAVEALIRAGFQSHGTLGSLARELQKRRKSDLAYQIEQRVPETGQDGAERMLASYVFLSGARGEDKADGWLYENAASIPDNQASFIACFGFSENLPGVVWTCDPRTEPHRSFEWLLRAALAPYESPPDEAHVAALKEHFAQAGDDEYTLLGRYLLGLESEKTALGRCVDPHTSCEVYFYVGYKAQTEGRFGDAARWYERCVATAQSRNGEFWWARSQLVRWGTSLRTLERLSARARAEHARPYLSTLGLM